MIIDELTLKRGGFVHLTETRLDLRAKLRLKVEHSMNPGVEGAVSVSATVLVQQRIYCMLHRIKSKSVPLSFPETLTCDVLL